MFKILGVGLSVFALIGIGAVAGALSLAAAGETQITQVGTEDADRRAADERLEGVVESLFGSAYPPVWWSLCGGHGLLLGFRAIAGVCPVRHGSALLTVDTPPSETYCSLSDMMTYTTYPIRNQTHYTESGEVS